MAETRCDVGKLGDQSRDNGGPETLTDMQMFEHVMIGVHPKGDREGHIYVVGFSNGLIKVGRSENIRSRMKAHFDQAAVHGSQLTSAWVSPARDYLQDVERELVDWCKQRGQRAAGREYFRGLGFEEVAAFACNQPVLFRPEMTAEQHAKSEAFSEGLENRLWGIPTTRAEFRQVVGDFIDSSDKEIAAFSRWRARCEWIARKVERVATARM